MENLMDFLQNNIGWSIILGFFIVSVILIAWSLYTAPTMPDDYGLKPEDIWPLEQRPSTKLKEATKKYKDANEEDKKGI